MSEELFDQLIQSLDEAMAIRRGEIPPSRVTLYDEDAENMFADLDLEDADGLYQEALDKHMQALYRQALQSYCQDLALPDLNRNRPTYNAAPFDPLRSIDIDLVAIEDALPLPETMKCRFPFFREPTHPGIMLYEEFMKPLGVTAEQLAGDIGEPVTTIQALIDKQHSITPDLAQKLSDYYRMTVLYWLQLQASWSVWHKTKHLRYKSEALESVHDTMRALHDIEAISDEQMREFDVACLRFVPQ